MRRYPGHHVALLAVIVVLAGCVSAPIGGQETVVSDRAPVTTPTPTLSDPGRTSPVSSSGDSRSAGGGPDYRQLYRETIDSVVMLRVTSDGRRVSGSGFVYDDRGHVVTNEHVVGSAGTVEVRYRRGEWRTGTVIGADGYADLAVVRVDDPPPYATALSVADENPHPGDPVVALGSPFGLEGTVTAGIVSGVNRSMPTERGFSIPATVQTDAAINPGNSGGPLVSHDGRVVGVNRATGGDNVGFAISAAIVDRVAPALIDHGRYDHAHMGVVTVEVTPTIAEANELDRATGLLLVGVQEGGPAEGVLRPSSSQTAVDGRTVPTGGDVIVAIDDRSIASQHDLARYLGLRTSPGQRVDVTVLRNGTRVTVGLTLDRRPAL